MLATSCGAYIALILAKFTDFLLFRRRALGTGEKRAIKKKGACHIFHKQRVNALKKVKEKKCNNDMYDVLVARLMQVQTDGSVRAPLVHPEEETIDHDKTTSCKRSCGIVNGTRTGYERTQANSALWTTSLLATIAHFGRMPREPLKGKQSSALTSGKGEGRCQTFKRSSIVTKCQTGRAKARVRVGLVNCYWVVVAGALVQDDAKLLALNTTPITLKRDSSARA